MSATHRTNVLATAILIALSGPGLTQDNSTTSLDVANLPTAVGAHAHREADFQHKPPSPRGPRAGIDWTLVNPPGLAENSWDFEHLDSIPGFGTLPQSYDVRPVLPRFSAD